MFWRIPLVTLGYLAVQAGRKAGIKGISRMEKSTELWKEFHKLHAEELEEEKQRKRGKINADLPHTIHN